MSQESALGQLMRMVGHVPPPMPAAPAQPNGKHAPPNGIARPQPARLPSGQPASLQALKQPEVGQKRKAAVPLPMTPAPPDPRLLFPAAMGALPPMLPGMPPLNGMQHPNAPKLPNGMPMPLNPQFLPPQLAAQMMMNPLLPAAHPAAAAPQLPPELLALAAQLAACGGNPMDAFTLMQNPAMLAKLYTHYAQFLQLQQQQQFHSLLAQQQAQAAQTAKHKRSTPTVRTSTATDLNKMDPLTSLQHLVNPQAAPPQRSPPAVKQEKPPTTPTVVREEPKDEVVVVDDEEKKNEVPITPTLPPKTSSAGSAFSIAEILQNAAEAAERPLPSTPTTASSQPPTADSSSSVASTADVSNADSQLSDATESLSGQSTQSSPNFVKKAAVSGVNKNAQRKKHIEFHRRVRISAAISLHFSKMKGINARCKFAQCQQCGGVVPNNSSELTHHVYGHSKKALFGCVNCEQRFNQKADLFRHSTTDHPKVKDHDQFHDLRDMGDLCDLLERCFPRNAKLVVDTLVNRLLHACEGLETLHCKVCDKEIPSNFNSLKNHLTQHPRYRCKMCHFTCDDEVAQIRHGEEHRPSGEPAGEPPAVLYNVTSAATVLSGVLTDCFGAYMKEDQLQFAEEISAMDRAQESPEPPKA
ncbi:hypothetical protein M3Y99_01820100 [Aphelenchoides fujianensis]|nr:hypothetical protein M3Y99_01820100 [Aphelenchoides fujianensis]